MTKKSIEQVLQEHTREWMSIPGVVGTAIGECDGEQCIRVLVIKKTPGLAERIPDVVQGFVLDIQETGRNPSLHSPEPG